MTSKRNIEHRLGEIEGDKEASGDGFRIIQIGGDPDRGGWYSWNAENDVYENEHGYEIPPEDAPESEFEFTIDNDEA